MNIQTILHATDFSAASRHAFELACSLARDKGARVVVLNVIGLPFPPIEPGSPCTELFDARTEAAALFTTLPKASDDLSVEYLITAGEPVSEIIRIAAEENADLIVLGTHGKAGRHRWLMGSVEAATLDLVHINGTYTQSHEHMRAISARK